MKILLGNVSEIHAPKITANFRRIATPPPDPYTLLDDFDLIEDQLLFSTTNAYSDKDAGKYASLSHRFVYDGDGPDHRSSRSTSLSCSIRF